MLSQLCCVHDSYFMGGKMLDCSEAEQSKAAIFVFGLDLLGYDMDWDTSGEAPAIQYRDDI